MSDSNHSSSSSPALDTGLICMLSIMRLSGVAADGEALRHQFAPPGGMMGDIELLRCAKAFQFKGKVVQTMWERLGKTPLPAMAKRRDGRYVLLVLFKDDKVLLQDPMECRPITLTRDLFESAWNGELILMTHRMRLTGHQRQFDISWFIPAVVKYRRLLGEVLLSSFFLQLFALVSPLFFQVVIDKVLVHQGLSTLHVLTFGLVTISIFESVLGGLRTYNFSHTAN
ncbi:MAG: cysteine peptidase family C39 domain-containing protein [Magnetococcus sp. DMHC-1]